MKTKIVLVFALCCMGLNTILAQTNEAALQSAMTKFKEAKSNPEMIAASSQLDMVATKWSDQWVNCFYAAYAKIKISFTLNEKEKRDQYLDAADAYLKKAETLSPNNEEILTLQAWNAKARIAVDGAERWKKYGEVYDRYIAKAKLINSESPRIFFLEGLGPFYKPKLWGGGKDKAKPYFEKAKALFATEDNTSMLMPKWGSIENEEFLKQCNED